MSVLDNTLKKHRKRIIDREEHAFREMLQAYKNVERELKRSIAELQKKVSDAKAAGQEISPAWLQQQDRLKTLVTQVKNQITRFGGTASRITAREQRAAIGIAIDQTKDMISAIAGDPFAAGSLLNPTAVENAVGMMGDGSPILDYYEKNLAPKVAQMIRQEVIKAAALGTDFRMISNRLLQTGQITRTRALATARTEVNRVRRETTRQIYQANSDVITGWEWVASRSARTCPACLALDGRVFDLDEVFPQHVNCRCTMIPVIDGIQRPLGSDWFDQQSDEIKEKILGKEGFAVVKDGQARLSDFVGWRNDKRFGKSVYTKPISRVLTGK